jgi:hypothetical protein
MPRRVLPLLLALIASPLYAAGHQPHGDSLEQRTPILLTAEEKSHIHLEMRMFLSTVQLIVSGIASNDMKLVAVAAHEAGMAATQDSPVKLRAKLPLQFKQLGLATHQGFDDLARDADSLGDPGQAMKQLGQIMNNCVSCHSTYRLETGRH